MEILLYSLLLSLGIQILFFIFAFLLKTDKLTDLTYGLTFIILVFFAITLSPMITVNKIILLAMICLWALRLISYLFYRINKMKKDTRFDEMRTDFLKFARFWIFQGISVWIIMLPSLIYFSQLKSHSFSIVSVLGIIIWFTGLLIETIADIQKFMFKSKPENKGLWIESGLWKYSRHPNYFGEILCWVGVFTFITPILRNWEFLTVISPLYITTLLLFVSGIPILEKRYNERYKNNRDYQEYKNSTSLLIPLP
ncbi:DUF1295 domain-containing protein [Candidatus Dojkabacteria bacterium]|nr:DUF1295 domain-containing protein [Candidatus Dojkabacteria bacterium]